MRSEYLNRLNEFPSYKGGHTCEYGGYVWEFCPGHHLQNHWGWVAQHRIIAEDILGRPLIRDKNPRRAEHVHHIDGNPMNNAVENLEVMTKSAHHSYEAKKYFAERYSHLTAEVVQGALVGRSIRDAAKHLNVVHQTLRNRFPEVLAPRKRKSPIKLCDASATEIVGRYAGNPAYSLRDVARAARISIRSVVRICERNDFAWVKKSRAGEMHKTYRKKPTPRFLASHALETGPAAQSDCRSDRGIPSRQRDLFSQE